MTLRRESSGSSSPMKVATLRKVLALLYVLSLVLGYCNGHPHCDSNIHPKERSHCKAWFYYTSNNTKCTNEGNTYHDILKFKDKEYVLQIPGFCMTYDEDNSSANLISCPYNVAKYHRMDKLHIPVNETLEDLNSFTCGRLNRVGLHCSKCNHSYGQSIFTIDLSCYDCLSSKYRGWGLYFFLEFIPLTIFIVVILILQVTPIKPNMKAFVFYSQIISASFYLGSEAPYEQVFGSKSEGYVKFLKTCYGFWNLDFFRGVIPPFCVTTGLDNLEVLMFQYMCVIYPTILVVVAWVIVDLYERGFRPIVNVWRPFRRCLSHFSVTNNPKRVIISAYATVLVLSYTKVLFVSGNLLKVASLYQVCQEMESKKHLFLQPDIPFLDSKHHVPLVILSLVMMFFFIFLPLLVLILYPIKSLQNRIRIRSTSLQIFTETFYECYKDGSNGGRDCRHFSTFYLFIRIILILIAIKATTYTESVKHFMATTAIYVVGIILLCSIRPYKEGVYNFLDASFMISFAISSFFSVVAIHNAEDTHFVTFFFLVIFLVSGLPLLYASIRVLVILIKWLKRVNVLSILRQRRRGYDEILEYGNEPETSIDSGEMERAGNEHYKRTAGNDSFQSE